MGGDVWARYIPSNTFEVDDEDFADNADIVDGNDSSSEDDDEGADNPEETMDEGTDTVTNAEDNMQTNDGTEEAHQAYLRKWEKLIDFNEHHRLQRAIHDQLINRN